jgi:MraZ protein
MGLPFRERPDLLFTGYSEHTIDAKQRLAIPAKYRNRWSAERDGATWACLPWPSGHLRLYTEKYFESLSQPGRPTLTPDKDTAELETTLFSLVENIEMDSAGRIILPKRHMELAGLRGDVVVAGAGNRLEIHDLTRWRERERSGFDALPELVERIQGRNLRARE